MLGITTGQDKLEASHAVGGRNQRHITRLSVKGTKDKEQDRKTWSLLVNYIVKKRNQKMCNKEKAMANYSLYNVVTSPGRITRNPKRFDKLNHLQKLESIYLYFPPSSQLFVYVSVL